jgi:hypothetical protein
MRISGRFDSLFKSAIYQKFPSFSNNKLDISDRWEDCNNEQ